VPLQTVNNGIRIEASTIGVNIMGQPAFKSYTFSFSYVERAYGWVLLREAVKLLVMGRCQLAVRMEQPKDVRMMAAAHGAQENHPSAAQ
jgi:hypothetical protein